MNQISNDIFYELCCHLRHHDILALLTTSKQFYFKRPLVEKIISDSKDKYILQWLGIHIGDSYENVSSVEKLHLSWNSFLFAPAEFGRLTALKKLHLHWCKLSALSTKISQSETLKNMDFRTIYH